MLKPAFGRLKDRLDADRDGEITLTDSKLHVSRIAPFAKKHTGFTAGVVAGFLTGYKIA